MVNADNELATDNIIILTKYIRNILLTAITPYNEQDLFQWYDNNKEQLQSNSRDNSTRHMIPTPDAKNANAKQSNMNIDG